MTPTADEIAAEIKAGLDGVTPGPWYTTGTPWFSSRDGVMVGSPDPHAGYLMADLDDGMNPRDEYEGHPLGDAELDAAHIARCSPDRLSTLIAAYEAQRAEIAARDALIAEAREVLEQARGLIRALPEFALGVVTHEPQSDDEAGWEHPIRDELADHLAKLLTKLSPPAPTKENADG